MGFLNRLFGANNKPVHIQYFSGWEVVLDGGRHCESFLDTHCVDEATALSERMYIKLEFDKNNRLSNAQLFSDGQPDNGTLNELLGAKRAIGKLAYRHIEPHPIYEIHKSHNGLHQLGGDPPGDFVMPANKLAAPFQYLGYIDNTDSVFTWLPFRLHLVCPVYLNIEQAFLDYSDPLRPVLLNSDDVEKAGCPYPALNEDSIIRYAATTIGLSVGKRSVSGIGHAGVPGWIQYPAIPLCPRTNKTMRFVCQLKSDAGVDIVRTNVIPSPGHEADDFKQMNFWGDGDLFVFFEPTSKIACFLIQNT